LFQRLVVGAVHDHHAQPVAADRDAADRLAALRVAAEASAVRGDRPATTGTDPSGLASRGISAV